MEKALKIKIIVSTLLICGIITFLGLKLVDKYTPSETMRALDNYYDVAPDEAVVLLENEIYAERALLRDGGIYLTLDTVDSLFNDGFYLDEAEQLLSYTLPEELIRVEAGKPYYYSNKETKELPHPAFLNLEGVYYLSLDFTAMVSDFTYAFYENPNRVVIHHQWIDFLYYDTVEAETPIRFEPDIKSDILRVVPAGEKLYYIGGTGTGGRSFFKVMTQDGIYGYVQKKFLGESYYDALQSVYTEPEYTHITMDEKVMLGWQQVTVAKANENLEQLVETAKEMNVISPTWYRLIDTEGNISSLANESYVQRAHDLGLQVWALIDNFDQNVSTYELMVSSETRAVLIDNMMAEAAKYGFDGWNIDFETLESKTGPHYIQFIKELSVRCRQEGIVLSVDNYVPASYNEFYDLEAQGKVVDYVIIMAYDEHYSGSETAGSVASLGFLKKAVNDTLKKMPKERIVMAIPFYTRLWAEQEADGAVKLSSEALTMNGAKDVLSRNKVTAQYDEASGQNYAEYKKNGITYKIWMEDMDSLHERLKVIAGADVAGMAAWRLGFETEQVWPVIEAYMNQ
ncbi:MAG: hypothetical protein IKL28_06215 [Lachnospiraceae bacterium]|nr:hypothetical protein [Lachnospiraceae bacterium]MBR6643235.1 hypothetical protein [Lachnospiraceae bacterium]